MSSPIILHNHPSHLGSPLQESGSLIGKVITKVYTTTNYLISSISSVAESILSNFIYVGSLGRYTLDDLKGHFSIKGFSEDKDRLTVSSKKDDIEEESISELANVLRKAKSGLERHDSKMSVDSITFQTVHLPYDFDTPHLSIYPNLENIVKLSTHRKDPKERLSEKKKYVINRGK